MKYQILDHSFLGKEIDGKSKYTIVGGGIAGLIIGFFLKQAGINFELLESSDRVGGMLDSHHSRFGTAEQAANGFIWCEEIEAVCRELDLPILTPDEASKARFLVRNKKLHRFPLNPLEAMVGLGRGLSPHWQKIETIADFGQVYFGKGFTQQILEPAFAGIYGADIRQLSFAGALSPLAKIMNQSAHLPLAIWKNKRKEAKENNQTKQKKQSGTHSFEGGMGALTQRLAEHLQENIRYGVNGLTAKDRKEKVVICTPAPVASQFFDGKIADLLKAIKYTPIITTTLVFKKSDLKRFKPGFGCLIPRSEGLQILGVLFNSYIFPNRVKENDLVSLTCIMRDDSPDLAEFNLLDIDLKNKIVKELNVLFEVEGNPVDYHIFRWPQGIPLYSPAMYQSLFEINDLLKKEYPNRNLFGNYTGEISIRGMFQTTSSVF